MIKAVRLSDPDVTPEGCLEALESAFGLAESGDDLYFAFRLLHQQPGEKLSDFLRRLEHALTKVVQRGGIPVNSMDTARVEQLLKGAVDADLMLINLRLRERRTKPPTFLELLREIRIEEEYEASRAKLNRSVSSVQVKPQADNRQSEIQSLKTELKEVKAMFAALATHSPAETEKGEKQLDSRELASENNVGPEVVALKKQVKQLEKKVGTRLSCQAGASPTVMAVETPSTRQSSDSEDRFCYRCGENGHIAPKCNKPENQNKVIQRLLGVLKKTRGKSQLATGKAIPEEVAGRVRKSAVDVLESHGLPEGLIGPPSLEPLKVNGHLCNALLDSGSRVSIIFESWYQRYLSDIPIHPVSRLNIWGLSDSSYPYRGYVVVDIEFPKKVVGAPTTMSVLALICPDPPGPDQTPVILGTNASANLPKRLAQLCEGTSSVSVTPLTVRSTCPEEDDDDEVGCVKWQGPGTLVLPAGMSGHFFCFFAFF